MTDFDEQFRKQFEGSDKKTPKEKKSEAPNQEPQKPSPPPEEKKVLQKDESKRERIRKNFFRGVNHNKNARGDTKHPHGFWHNFLIGTANILIIIGVVVLIRTFLVSPFSVVGSSMSSNLSDGDLILVDKISYRLSEPKRGDIIVFHPPTNELNEQRGLICRAKKIGFVLLGKDSKNACISRDFYVKRIIGIPGDTVEIRNRNVYVTPQEGERIEAQEDFLDTRNQNNTCFSPNCNSSRDTKGVFVEVPENTYYVLGDNRTGSSDSRKWKVDGKDTPFVLKEDISGKVQMVFFPFTNVSILPNINPLESKNE